jgi:[acyl-carrier-protein] S-malonyltransferase
VATVIAVVAGRPIDLAALEQRMADVRRGPRGRHLPPENAGPESTRLGRWLVQELVTEAVLAHESRAAGLTGSPEMAIAGLVERVTFSVTVPARDVRGYYVRNRDRYRRREARRVRHILLPDEASAREAARRIAAGEEMSALAAARSIDAGSRSSGGVLGEVHRGELSGPLEDALFDAQPGAVIGPVQTEHGWHVARVEAVSPESVVPYRDARPAIEAELLAAERTRVFAAWLEDRRAALAVIEPAFEHPAHPIHGFPSHRH